MAFLAYMDPFWVLTLISLAAVSLAMPLRRVKLGGALHMGHGEQEGDRRARKRLGAALIY